MLYSWPSVQLQILAPCTVLHMHFPSRVLGTNPLFWLEGFVLVPTLPGKLLQADSFLSCQFRSQSSKIASPHHLNRNSVTVYDNDVIIIAVIVRPSSPSNFFICLSAWCGHCRVSHQNLFTFLYTSREGNTARCVPTSCGDRQIIRPDFIQTCGWRLRVGT